MIKMAGGMWSIGSAFAIEDSFYIRYMSSKESLKVVLKLQNTGY